MAHKSFLPPRLATYAFENWLREPEILRQLREETALMPNGGMQIPPDQGQFMRLLVQAVGAKRCLEVGVFTGYSSLSVALALPLDGEIVACDISEEFTAMARHYWDRAGVSDRIQLHIGPALETLDRLLEAGEADSFDLVFIDADKPNTHAYFERALQLVKVNGLILIDNVLWAGRVADRREKDDDTEFFRRLNSALRDDNRIDLALVPIGDGVTLARKR